MFIVRCRIGGSVVGEGRYATLAEAREALARRRRALIAAGAVIITERPGWAIGARLPEGWAVVTITRDWSP